MSSKIRLQLTVNGRLGLVTLTAQQRVGTESNSGPGAAYSRQTNPTGKSAMEIELNREIVTPLQNVQVE